MQWEMLSFKVNKETNILQDLVLGKHYLPKLLRDVGKTERKEIILVQYKCPRFNP